MKMLYSRLRNDSQPSAVTPDELVCLRAQSLIKSTNLFLFMVMIMAIVIVMVIGIVMVSFGL